MSDTENKEDRTQEVISKLVKICKTANDKYPSGTDYRYFCSYPSFNEQSNNLSKNVLQMLNKLCNFVNPNDNQIDLLSENNEYLRWQTISDSADHCIEKVDLSLDNIREQNNHQTLHNGTASKATHSSNKQNKLFSGQIRDNNSLELLYPQKRFLELIDNKRNTPFKPNLIHGKSNSKQPFVLKLIGDEDDKYYAHPYRYEIENIEYHSDQLTHRKEEDAHAISHTLVYWIETEDALSEMADALSCSKAIAVDLEHHRKHSFLGMTCLIQISTRNRDYLIDPLALREHIHTYLNPIFTNPNIIKVFHGCMNDIQWLQRDFSVYVVNLFDTFEAAKLLNLKQKSFKYLLKTYCDVDTNKALRTTDWRVRPLRPELIDYARKDTHYLLYIYDHLTNLLIEQSVKDRDLLNECYENSAMQCLIRYEKPRYNPKGWQYLCQKKGWYFINPKSLNALSTLCEWRDRIARELDQSVEVVLSDRLLKRIVNDLPQDELPAHVYYLSIIARKYVKDIVNIIQSTQADDKKSIDPMFEVTSEAMDDCSEDLDTICVSNEGRLMMNNDHKMDVETCDDDTLDMIPIKGDKGSFFPMIDAVDGAVHHVVNGIFNEISNEPVFNQTYKEDKKGKKKGKKRPHFNRNENKKQKKNEAKLKGNNMERVASAADRGKIFGSRYLDRNSKKDVFKLPRGTADKKNKKRNRKEMEVGMSSNLMKDIEPPKKKKKVSKYRKMQEQLKLARQRTREKKTKAVQKEWPMDKTHATPKRKGVNESKKQIIERETNRNVQNNDNDKAEDVEVTEADLLNEAPVPVLDPQFENVYDPFKTDD
eukprot:98542_1